MRCGKSLSIKDEFAGRRVKCPGCQILLRVPRPSVEVESFGDDWDLEDSAEQDFDEEPTETRAKSRSGKSLSTRGPNSRQTSLKTKGKKPQPAKRGLLIGLSAGGGLLVIALAAWTLWPENEGSNVAVAPNQITAASPSTIGGDSTSNANTAAANPGLQPNVGAANPAAPSTTIATKLEGDLNLLQGTWQVTDVGVAADQPGAAEMIAASKQVTLTVKDDVLTMASPGGTTFSSLKLDSTKQPGTIDLIPLDGGGRKTGLGIYALAGDSWTLCISFQWRLTSDGDVVNKDLEHALLTLKKETLATIGDSAAPTLGTQFDIKAWQQASARLQAMKVRASLEPWEKFVGTEGPTHFVSLTLPETAGRNNIAGTLGDRVIDQSCWRNHDIRH